MEKELYCPYCGIQLEKQENENLCPNCDMIFDDENSEIQPLSYTYNVGEYVTYWDGKRKAKIGERKLVNNDFGLKEDAYFLEGVGTFWWYELGKIE